MQKNIEKIYINRSEYKPKLINKQLISHEYNIKIDNDILYLHNILYNIYSLNLNNPDIVLNIFDINFSDYLITNNDILYIKYTGLNSGTTLCKYNNGKNDIIYKNNNDSMWNITTNDNKIYLFNSSKYHNNVIIINENGEQEIKIKYDEFTSYSSCIYDPCFNINNSLYIMLGNSIYLISDMSNIKIDKSIDIDFDYKCHRYMIIDYYDNILFNSDHNTEINVYSPDLEYIHTFDTIYRRKSNIVTYYKFIYYINSNDELCREEYGY